METNPNPVPYRRPTTETPMRWEDTRDPRCDIEAEVRTGTHAVNAHSGVGAEVDPRAVELDLDLDVGRTESRHSHSQRSRPRDLEHAPHLAAHAPLPPHTLTLSLSRSLSRSRSQPPPRSVKSVKEKDLPLALAPVPDETRTGIGAGEKDVEGALEEATTAVGDDDKDVYEDPGLWGWLDCLGVSESTTGGADCR